MTPVISTHLAIATPAGQPLHLVHNRTFHEMALGDTATLQRTLTTHDIELLSVVASNTSQKKSDGAHAAGHHDPIAHSVWGSSMITALLDTRLPGTGTVLLNQQLQFLVPIKLGDTLTLTMTIRALDAANKQVTLSCSSCNQDQEEVIRGEVTVIAPELKIDYLSASMPTLHFLDGAQRLLDHVRALGSIRVAVVHPCDALSLSSAIDAQAAGLIVPVLIAPLAKLNAVAKEAGLDLTGLEIVDVEHSHAAASRAVELAHAGQVEALMKGSLHTDELMGAVVASGTGLRTARRISHCFLMQTPAYPRPFIITDAAVNISPTLEGKADIIRNAIDLAHAIGVAQPRVAILAAVETVNPSMQSTLDAAALCKMADRGQIAGALLDGPLAFDNAVSMAAVKIKGIVSEVAGQADILVVPDLESGNMLAKQLEYRGGAECAGIVLGAKLPIVLTSRADSRDSRISSCAIAVLLAHRNRKNAP